MKQNVKKQDKGENNIKSNTEVVFAFAFLKAIEGESTRCRLFGDPAKKKERINLNKFNQSNIDTPIRKDKRNVLVMFQVFMTRKKGPACLKEKPMQSDEHFLK